MFSVDVEPADLDMQRAPDVGRKGEGRNHPTTTHPHSVALASRSVVLASRSPSHFGRVQQFSFYVIYVIFPFIFDLIVHVLCFHKQRGNFASHFVGSSSNFPIFYMYGFSCY